MNSKTLLMFALLQGAKRQSVDSGRTLRLILEDLVIGRYETEFKEGRTLISSSEAGGTVTFQIAEGLSPAEILELAIMAQVFCARQTDPENPRLLPRIIKRMRVSFAQAQV